MAENERRLGKILIRNREHNTLPYIIHGGGCWSGDLWRFIETQYFLGSHGHTGGWKALDDLEIVTINTTGADTPLIASMQRLGVPRYQQLGYGLDVDKGKFLQQRWQAKILAQALPKVEKPFVLYADAFDSVMVKYPGALMQTYLNSFAPNSIVFAGCVDSWPPEKELTVSESRKRTGWTKYFFLNAGMFIGPTSLCAEFFEKALKVPVGKDSPTGSQYLCRKVYATEPTGVTLDYKCQMFQNVYGLGKDELDILWLENEMAVVLS